MRAGCCASSAPSVGKGWQSAWTRVTWASPARAGFRAERIGFVFQQFHLVPYLSVLENVLVPALARPQPGAMDRARQLIGHFGLEQRTQHVPAELSVGEGWRPR